MGLGGNVAGAAAVLGVVGGLVLLSGPTVEQPQPAALTQAAPAEVEYGWPTGSPATVVRPYEPPPERWAAGHRGADLAMGDGAPVLAAADGVVVFAGSVAGRGIVSIDHADGIRTTYEPVSAVVRRGAGVTRGDAIGTLAGLGHCAPELCLHWGARRGRDDYLDPLSLVTAEVVIRLLPLHGGG